MANRGAGEVCIFQFLWLQDERQGFYGRYGGHGSDSKTGRRGRIELALGPSVQTLRQAEPTRSILISADSTSGEHQQQCVVHVKLANRYFLCFHHGPLYH